MPREKPYNSSKLGTPTNILVQPNSPSAILLMEILPAFKSLAVGQGLAVMLDSTNIGKYVQLLGFANEATSLTSSANTFHK